MDIGEIVNQAGKVQKIGLNLKGGLLHPAVSGNKFSVRGTSGTVTENKEDS